MFSRTPSFRPFKNKDEDGAGYRERREDRPEEREAPLLARPFPAAWQHRLPSRLFLMRMGMAADATGRITRPPTSLSATGAPCFHNGSPVTLLDAVNFYDQRFNLGFTVIPESP
jgi:cytochrome c peroxidase